MPDLKRITLTSGTTYDVVDQGARDLIDGLTGYTKYLGVTTTPLTDGSSTNPITIDGESVTAETGNIVNYNSKEFIFNGNVWQEFGDLSGLGDLAFKDSASGSYTPSGTVSKPTFTGTQGTVNVSGSISSGTVSIDTGTGTANYTPAGSVSQPTFSGSELTSTGKFTPSGSISKPNVNVTPTTTTVNSITDVGTLPELTMTVQNETLVFGWDAGTLPTKGSNTSVMTGASAALASNPTFTGTEGNVSVKGTPGGTVSKPTFSGTGVKLVGSIDNGSVSASGSFTPNGTVSQPTFTGNSATIEVE